MRLVSSVIKLNSNRYTAFIALLRWLNTALYNVDGLMFSYQYAVRVHDDVLLLHTDRDGEKIKGSV